MRCWSLACSVVVGSIVLCCVGAASADEPPPQSPHEESPAPAPEGAPRYDLLRANLGLRYGYLRSRGYDTFSTNDVLTQWSLDATYPVVAWRKLVVGVGIGWDYGGSSANARSFETSLATHRLYVPIEARYYVLPSVAVFGKVAPGAVAALASVHEPSAPNDLSATGWAFSTDASVGASILLGPRNRPDLRQPRVWATPEIGYAVTTKASLGANPGRDAQDVLGSDEDTRLGALSLSGLFWRLSVGMTF